MTNVADPLASVLHENSCAAFCPFGRMCQDKAGNEILPDLCNKEHETLAEETKHLEGVVYDRKSASIRMGLTVWVTIEETGGYIPIVLRNGERVRG